MGKRLTEAQARKLLGGRAPRVLGALGPDVDPPDAGGGEAIPRVPTFCADQIRSNAIESDGRGWQSWRICPVPAPRQVASDKWKRGRDLRPGVRAYRAFQDEVRLRNVWQPRPGDLLLFALPMPPSWPMVKRIKMRGGPHTSKPDLDNLVKALLDSLYEDDSAIWALAASKVWADFGSITIFRGVLPSTPMTVPA